MKLKSNFSSDLDFKPQDPWSAAIPAIALNDQLLCGFDLSPSHPVFQHTSTNLEFNLSLIKSIYPILTLSELARLIKCSAFSSYFQIDSILKSYGFHSSPEFLETLDGLFKSPLAFQNFVSVKKMGHHDLTPLLNLNNEEILFVTNNLINSNESKQDSVKRLELLADLLQMGHKYESLNSLSLKKLTEFRYPVTSSRDAELKSTQLPWLSQIRSQFKRRGDKAGFEITFFAGTPVELAKLAQNLTQVANVWNKDQ